MKKNILLILALSSTLLFCGCSSLGKSIGLGGAIGAGSGAIIGGIADPGSKGKYRTRNVIVGSALGGIAGMAAGSAIHGSNDDARKRGYQAGKSSTQHNSQGAPPLLKDPKVETRWVEGKAAGNRYIEGHFEYIIAEPTRWDID